MLPDIEIFCTAVFAQPSRTEPAHEVGRTYRPTFSFGLFVYMFQAMMTKVTNDDFSHRAGLQGVTTGPEGSASGSRAPGFLMAMLFLCGGVVGSSLYTPVFEFTYL